jgi:hypothetical protein
MPTLTITNDELFTLQAAVENLRGGASDPDAKFRIASKIETMIKGVKPEVKWIREDQALPRIAQPILLAHPRQSGDFWDILTAKLLVRHEDVCPIPKPQGDWPTEWWWETNRGGSAQSSPILVTGNSWWTHLDDIPPNLPPGAQHVHDAHGYRYVIQTEAFWVQKKGR